MIQTLDCPECNETGSGEISGSGTIKDPYIYTCWACDTEFYPDFTLVDP